MKVLIAGGGSGGHIVPAIAIADYIRKRQPDSKILFVGALRGLEKDLVPKAGYNIKFIEILGFKRKINLAFFKQNIKTVCKLGGSIKESRRIIEQFSPDVVVGTGGYVSGPVLYAAAKMNIPTLIHESNVYPGMASKILARYVNYTCISFKSSEKYFRKKAKIILTGNPLREGMFTMTRRDARKQLGIPDGSPFIVASGGSLGGKGFNDAVLAYIKAKKGKENYHMLFSTGETNYQTVMDEFNKIYREPPKNITILPFIYNMPTAQVASDLIIGRGGAMTLSEINAAGKPSILIPCPTVTMNHQEYNTRALSDAGAAFMFTERELAGGYQGFIDAVDSVIGDPQRRRKMEENSRAMGITNGMQTIYELIIKLHEKKYHTVKTRKR